MNTITLTYGLLITLLLGVSSMTAATSRQELLFAALYIPLPVYFALRLFRQLLRTERLKRIKQEEVKELAYLQTQSPTISDALEGEVIDDPRVRDIDKRLFLKLIGSGGVTLFMLSIFTKKTHAAFFGSVPGPGTVAIKDSAGNQIDPAEKQPTDGYEIAQVDDTSSSDYAWYGFVDKDGNWYVMQEDLTGADAGTYLYATGTTDFATNWGNRNGGLSYGTFDTKF